MKTKQKRLSARSAWVATSRKCQQSFPEMMPGWMTNKSNTTRSPFDHQQWTRRLGVIELRLRCPVIVLSESLKPLLVSSIIMSKIKITHKLLYRAKHGYPARYGEAVTCWQECCRHGSCTSYSWSHFTELRADNTGALEKKPVQARAEGHRTHLRSGFLCPHTGSCWKSDGWAKGGRTGPKVKLKT